MLPCARRGFMPKDVREFNPPSLQKLGCAADDLRELLDRGYAKKTALVFVGNHYLLSERQRVAVMRTVSSKKDVRLRRLKQLSSFDLSGQFVVIDGFNIVITLEVALSGGPVFRCMDGSYRDLAGLRGTYHLIRETSTALRLILEQLKVLQVASATFYFDKPVSNSGRLKSLLLEIAENSGVVVTAEITDQVDHILSSLPNVITADSIILDQCRS